MLALLSNGMSSVMKAPLSLIPLAKLTINGLFFASFFILSENGTITEEGNTSNTASALRKTESSSVAVIPGFRNLVGKYFVF